MRLYICAAQAMQICRWRKLLGKIRMGEAWLVVCAGGALAPAAVLSCRDFASHRRLRYSPSAPQRRASVRSRPMSSSDLRSVHILVVDDVADSRDLFALFLRIQGFVVETAGSGPDALSRARHQSPDVIVTDIVMPAMDGFELCRELRREWPHVPIIAITARALTTAERRLLESDLCDVLLTKPCTPEDMLAAVRHVLNGRRETPSSPPTE